MKLSISLTLLMFVNISGAQSTELPMTQTADEYVIHQVQVYDGNTGKGFPYRISLSSEIGGCSSADFTIKEVKNYFHTTTYFVQIDGFTPAIVCEKPSRIYTQSFNFSKGPAFLKIVAPTDTAVKVERIQE